MTTGVGEQLTPRAETGDRVSPLLADDRIEGPLPQSLFTGGDVESSVGTGGAPWRGQQQVGDLVVQFMALSGQLVVRIVLVLGE